MITANTYIGAMDEAGVAELSSEMKLRFINLARQEVYDAYPWEFRKSSPSGVNAQTINDPWTTPLSSPDMGMKISSVIDKYGNNLSPVTQDRMKARGITFDPSTPAPPQTNPPGYYCVYNVLQTSDEDEPVWNTYVVPDPYSTQIRVTTLSECSPLTLEEEPSSIDYMIPRGYMMLVVYRALVHAYVHIGVPDLVDSYASRYEEIFASLVRNQTDFGQEIPDIEYDLGP